jgi:hypothetical protein
VAGREHGCTFLAISLACKVFLGKIVTKAIMPPSAGNTRIVMILSLLRSLKVRQIGQIQMHIGLNGTAVTPVASGPDAAFVSAVEKLGTGQYKITLKDKAKSNVVVSSIVASTNARICKSHATDTESVTIYTFSDAGVAADADIMVQIQFFDQLSYFF